VALCLAERLNIWELKAQLGWSRRSNLVDAQLACATRDATHCKADNSFKPRLAAEPRGKSHLGSSNRFASLRHCSCTTGVFRATSHIVLCTLERYKLVVVLG